MPEIDTEKVEKFLKTLTWYFSEKSTPTGLFSTIGRIDEKLGQLNQNLINSSEAQDKLTKSLNRITLVGVVATVIAAFATLLGLIPPFYDFILKIRGQ